MSKQKENDVIAKCYLYKNGKENQLWIVPCCPFCSKKHIHGAGSYKDDPKKFLSYRNAHCITDKLRSYLLVEDKRKL